MTWKAIYTDRALKDLSKLPKQTAKRILDKVKFFRQQPEPLSFAKKLKDSQYGEYRFRVGTYRVIFDVDHAGEIRVLLVLRVKHRREVYE